MRKIDFLKTSLKCSVLSSNLLNCSAMEEEILNEEKILNHKDYTQFKKINNKNYKIYNTFVYGFNKNDSERSTEFEIIYKKNLNFNDNSQLINIKDNKKKNLVI